MINKNNDTGWKISLHKTFMLTAVIIVLIMGVSGGACLLFYFNTVASEQYRMELHQNAVLNIAVHRVSDALYGIISDLKFLSSHTVIISLLTQDSTAAKAELADEFLSFVRHKSVYDQIRLLNTNGWEVLRVNLNNGQPYIVTTDLLQDKHERYYFKKVADTQSNAIYISAFDLNMENSQVERPLKPTIRFSQPIFSDNDRFLGVLVLNYLGKQILDKIKDENRLSDGDMMLVNSDGYWLSNPNPEREWGFMLPERNAQRFNQSFPKEWRHIATGKEGRFSTANGLFAYKAFSLGHMIAKFRNDVIKVPPQCQRWLFVHHIPMKMIHQRFAVLRKNMFLLWGAMTLFAAVPAWLLSSAFLKRRQTQYQMWRMANFDTLTGLFNRSSFMHELKQLVLQGKRYGHKFILLYLDLDGFKQINDTIGHAAGDQLLQQIAQRFQAALRASDYVARLGGDEFCILAREIGTADEAAHIADKLIDTVAVPFDLDGKTGRVGTSIGIARFPSDNDTADGLLKMADKAMYAAKSGGKNRYCFYLDQPETD